MHTIYLNKYKFLIIFHIFQMTKSLTFKSLRIPFLVKRNLTTNA